MATTGKTEFLIQREGADAYAASAESKRLIEAIPRKISSNEKWLVNMTTARIEMASPMMLELGDTIYVEYEPTQDELVALKAGKSVTVSRTMLARLRSGEATSVVDQMELPQSVAEEQRRARAIRLHGVEAGQQVAGAQAAAHAAVAAEAAFATAAPMEPVPPVTAAQAFTIAPMPA